MADLSELEAALVKADRAGNTDDARALAAEIMRMRAQPTEPSSTLAVAGQAVLKGAAALPDAVLNTPANLGNLAMMAYATGRPEAAAKAELFEPPNLIRGGLEKAGLITPEGEPQTGGQRILDRAIQTGVGVAVAPAKGITDVALNVGSGLFSGAAAGLTKEVTGSDTAALLVGMATPMITAAAGSRANQPTLKNPVRSQTVREAQEAGYVIPPSAVKPSFTTNRLESVAGKAAVKQEAAAQNQEVTNRLAAKSLGLPEETILTESTLNQVRSDAGKAYQAIADLSPRAASALERLKEVRNNITAYFKHYDRSADPASLKEARKLTTQANMLERVIEKQAQAAGKPELVQGYLDARQLTAKSYDIERALNLGDGNVSATIIGRMLDQGKPLTGELKVIGKFAQAFPSITREGITSAGVSGTDPALAALLASQGHVAAGGLPLLRGPVRSGLMSNLYQQRLLAQPPTLGQAATRSVLAGRSIADYQ